MTCSNSPAGCFEAERGRLQAMALRILGSPEEAEDAVQETWVRASRVEGEVANPMGWLTTVISHVCFDLLRSRKSRREEPLPGEEQDETLMAEAPSPEQEAMLSDAVGYALQVVLDTLGPAERVAFVLHDLFGLSFEDIGPIVSRSEAAARQLANRARRRMRGAAALPEADFRRKQELIEVFVAAARDGDLQRLLAVLDPDVELGGDPGIAGRDAVGKFFCGRAQGARPALIDGAPGIVVRRGERVFLILQVDISVHGIARFDVVLEPGRLAEFDIAVLEA